MNKLDLALSLIRPSNKSKLTDRAWVVPIIFASLIMIAAFLNKVDFNTAINVVMVLVGGPAAAEKLKDALIGSAAVKESSNPTAIGTVENLKTPSNSSSYAQIEDEFNFDADADEVQKNSLLEQEQRG